MKELYGSPGKVSGLVLRIGQCLFGAASIGVMVSASGFSTPTAFCYLIAAMGLQVLWSFGLACLDLHALMLKRNLQNPVLVSLFVVGDWVVPMVSMGMGGGIFDGAEVLTRTDIKSIHVRLNKERPDFNFPVTAILSLAAACSSAGVTVLYARDTNICTHLPCSRFHISVALAFISWFLLAISSHVMFWLLASV